MALFRIRMYARGTVIWPALYRPVYVLSACSMSFLTASRLPLKPTLGMRIRDEYKRYKNETGTCQCVLREKKGNEKTICRFDFDFRPDLDRSWFVRSCRVPFSFFFARKCFQGTFRSWKKLLVLS